MHCRVIESLRKVGNVTVYSLQVKETHRSGSAGFSRVPCTSIRRVETFQHEWPFERAFVCKLWRWKYYQI